MKMPLQIFILRACGLRHHVRFHDKNTMRFSFIRIFSPALVQAHLAGQKKLTVVRPGRRKVLKKRTGLILLTVQAG